ncbi:hypothetical protein BDB01DRAFT_778208 [Pilobolus umbonatus]|nr:hypothetical protein BDB01DRAFT_778208 [Pilobolus umbonatus]
MIQSSKSHHTRTPSPPQHTVYMKYNGTKQDRPSQESIRMQRESNSSCTTSSSSLSSSSPPPFLKNPNRNYSFSSSQQSFQSTLSDHLLNHSHLKPGENASLLSYNETINMYRKNVKKTRNKEIQCNFAIFLVEVAKRLLQSQSSDHSDLNVDSDQHAYIMEAEKILKQIALRGHSESQYYLANMYAAGLLNKSSKPDYDKAFPLFIQSAKHHHPDAAYRTANCYEDGLGTRKDKRKAVQFYRKAATLNHPAAMYRLGIAQMNGELGLSRCIRDGHKWLKRSAEAATYQYPQALHELAVLHEKGVEPVIFADVNYAISLFHEAALLNYAPSAFRLGECYEYGSLGCNIDPALSYQYYSIAAEQNHPEACFAMTSWCLEGIPGVVPPSDEQAYLWAMNAAQNELPRAEYAVGYFLEGGIGVMKDEVKAKEWYIKAAHHGERKALDRLQLNERPADKKVKSRKFSTIKTKQASDDNDGQGSTLFRRATSFLRNSSKK